MGTHRRDSSTGKLSNWPVGHPDTIQTPAFEGHIGSALVMMFQAETI